MLIVFLDNLQLSRIHFLELYCKLDLHVQENWKSHTGKNYGNLFRHLRKCLILLNWLSIRYTHFYCKKLAIINAIVFYKCLLDWSTRNCLGSFKHFVKWFVKPISIGQRLDASKRELATAIKSELFNQSYFTDFLFRKLMHIFERLLFRCSYEF